MNIPHSTFRHRAFTLIELMVAMAITVIIVSVLVFITATATDTWNRSRSELRASRQAKEMINVMSKDFEGLVSRKGNSSEWLVAEQAQVENTSAGSAAIVKGNSSKFVFFTAAADRYNGDIGLGSTNDKGGDISAVGYRLYYKDPINKGSVAYPALVFQRLLVNPNDAFTNLLGNKVADGGLLGAFEKSYATELAKGENFVCENIYQYTVTFNVEVNRVSTGPPATTTQVIVPVVIASGAVTSFKLSGTGIVTSGLPTGVTQDELKAGRITSIVVSITVLSDAAVNLMSKSTMQLSPSAVDEILRKHSFNYVKRTQVSSM